MIKQFRPNVGAFTLEFLTGGISPNESPEDAAGREFAEETSARMQVCVSWGL